MIRELVNNTKNNHSNIEVVKFYIINSKKTVNEMYGRSFEINTDIGTVKNLVNTVANSPVIDRSNIVRRCGSMVGLSPVTSGLINVPNGWNHNRLSFVLHVEVKENSGKTSMYFLNGFTEFYDPLMEVRDITSINQLDHQMVFHINTITLVDRIIGEDKRDYYKLRDKVTLLRDITGTSYDSMISDKELIRPSDIMTKIHANVSTYYGNTVNEVNRTSSNTIGYLATLMDNLKASIEVDNTGGYVENNHIKNITHKAANRAEEENGRVLDCPFMLMLYRETGEARPSYFTLANMLTITPYLDYGNITEFISVVPTRDKTIMSSENLSNIVQPTIESMLAQETYHSLASLFFDNNVTSADITISNHPMFFREDVCYVNGLKSLFHPIFASMETESFIATTIRNVIMPKITSNGDRLINVHVSLDVIGYTTIGITVGDGYDEVFRFNSAMDNCFNPNIATSQQSDIITDDVSTIVDEYTGDNYEY